MNVTGCHALVVGLGRSGQAAVRLLHRKGASVAVSDVASRDKLAGVLTELEPMCEQVETDGHSEELFRWADLIVVSPGVPLSLPVFEIAGETGAEIIAEVELAYRFLDCPLIGVTGTNGKSTVTALVGAMLKAAGRRVFVGGNFGRPLIEALEEVTGEDLAVVELSSFQLEGIRTLRPQVAALLNLEPDHLDRYDELSDYERAKGRIFHKQLPSDAAVLNASDPKVMAQVVRLQSRLHTFGQPGAHAWIENGTLHLKSDYFSDDIDVGDFVLPGVHNRLNLEAAGLVARLAGADAEAIGLAAGTFSGLPHRLESLGEVGGVRYINDSKATTVDSVKTALAAMDRPVVLILGGRDKGADWQDLAPYLPGKVKAAVAYGEAAEKIAGELAIIPVRIVELFVEALEAAASVAKAGDAVLLSPACASFDQFTSFEARGETMRQWVKSR